MSLGLLAILAQTALCSGTKFVIDKSYRDELAFRKQLGKPFVSLSSTSLNFFGDEGKPIRSVSLIGESHKGTDPFGKDSWAISKSAILGSQGIVLVSLGRGYESCGTAMTLFSRTGTELGDLKAPSCGYLISPRGDRIVSAHSEGYHHLPLFSLFGSTGGLVAQFNAAQGIGLSPRFAFSPQGDYGVILFGAPRGQGGGIIFFDADGKEVSRYQSEVWTPLSSTIEDTGLPLHALAKIDQTNRVLVAQGIHDVPSKRSLKGISFEGKELWNLERAGQDCPATVIVKPMAKTSVLLEFCANGITTTKMDTLTGQVQASTMSIPSAGKPVYAIPSLSPDEGFILVNLREQSSAGDMMRFLLLDSNLDLIWHAESKDADSRMSFTEGSVIRMDGRKFSVGRFVTR